MFRVTFNQTIKVFEPQTVYNPESELLTWFERHIEDYREYIDSGSLDLLGKMEECGYQLINNQEYDDWEIQFNDFNFETVFAFPNKDLVDKPLKLSTILHNVFIKVSIKIPSKWFKLK